MLALIATDGTEAAVAAAREAVGLLPAGCTLDVVTVIPRIEDPLDSAGGIEGPVISQEEADAEAARAEVAGRLALDVTSRALGEHITIELVRGDNPGEVVCALAAERRADVLVVGGSAKGWFDRLIHGSVMEYTVHHSPCPVLVVRHPDHVGGDGPDGGSGG